MEDCIFCKIIAGEIPCHKIYEDDRVFAFLDTAEDADGHTLVVPKTHCRNLLDVPPDVLAQVMAGVQKVARHYVDACGFRGVNVLNFSEPCAGQTVFHLHFHILPRTPGDGVFAMPREKKCKFTLPQMRERLQMR
jgi:histidine triad (HIT) family protein